MRVYAAELICSTGVSGFQIFKPVFCIYNNLRLHAEMLTHWRLNEIAHDPPLIPWRFLEYFRTSESTKINHMRSNHRHKIGFQDVVYSKLNKWRAKILKNIDKKTSTWWVKLIRKQEIILFLYRATKCPADAEKIEYAKMSSLSTSEDKPKPNTTEFPFLYYLGWHLRKQQKIKAKNSSKNQSENKKSNNFFAERRNSITAEERWKLQIKKTKKTSQLFRDQSYFSWVKLVPIYFFSHLFTLAK